MMMHASRSAAVSPIGGGACLALMLLAVAGSSTFRGWIANAGPSEQEIANAAAKSGAVIALIEIDAALAVRLAQAEKQDSLADAFSSPPVADYVLGRGDTVEVS